MTDETPQVDHERVLLDALDTCLQHGNPPSRAARSEWLGGMWLTTPAEARAALLTRLAADAVGAPLGNADDRACHLSQQAREHGAEFRLTPQDVPLHLRPEHIRAALDLRAAAHRQAAR
ncbi:hypothetical protein DEH18_33530 [Streptomyces sp. NHF165]|uniref:hypothetical protein n=1 Tax=Streptomyces sp. NHF165 TaxID=2175864 RepID=UPI00132E9440|nr:hypothetical protein [Streptomyces sp. NHF165]QHF97948.1 hypothetical protein DEH18_33530 [Streptomyces sp. NHF165]